MEENPLKILYSGVKNKNIIENKDGAIEKWTFVSSLFFDLVVKLKKSLQSIYKNDFVVGRLHMALV